MRRAPPASPRCSCRDAASAEIGCDRKDCGTSCSSCDPSMAFEREREPGCGVGWRFSAPPSLLPLVVLLVVDPPCLSNHVYCSPELCPSVRLDDPECPPLPSEVAVFDEVAPSIRSWMTQRDMPVSASSGLPASSSPSSPGGRYMPLMARATSRSSTGLVTGFVVTESMPLEMQRCRS